MRGALTVSSVVILAWRLRFMTRVRERFSSAALSDALFMAFMRAASSEASASYSQRGGRAMQKAWWERAPTFCARLAVRARRHREAGRPQAGRACT